MEKMNKDEKRADNLWNRLINAYDTAVIFSIEEWRFLLSYRTPIKDLETKPGILGMLCGHFPRTICSIGGHKHPIIQTLVYDKNSLYSCGKKIIIEK